MKPSRLFCALAGAASLGLPLSLPAMAASPGKMTLQDIMQFESLKKPVLADNGKLLAVEVAPDRGDSRTLIKGTNGKPELSIAGASDPVVSADGRYVAMKLEPSLLAKETSDAKAKKKLKAGMVLVEVASGKEQRFERVKDFAFDDSGKVLAIWFEPEDEKKDKEKDDDKVGDTAKGEANSKAPEQTVKADEAKKPKIDKADKGSALTLLALASGKQAEFNDVTAYAFDKQGNTAAVLINDIANTTHRLMAVSLSSLDTSARFESASEQLGALALSPDGSQIAFSAGSADTRIDERAYRLGLIDATGKVTFAAHPQSWQLNRYSSMSFSKDGERIFFGYCARSQQGVVTQGL